MSSLSKPVLVLNKMWMPIRVISVKRCLNLVFSDKASLVDPSDYSVYKWEEWVKLDASLDKEPITTTSNNVKLPEVIVLLKYDKVHNKDVRLTKRNIYIRDKCRCQYTGKHLNRDEADIDHIIPRAQGGKNTWDNLVCCSKDINRVKADRTPEQAGLKLIKRPSKPVLEGPIRLFDPQFVMPESWSKFLKN